MTPRPTRPVRRPAATPPQAAPPATRAPAAPPAARPGARPTPAPSVPVAIPPAAPERTPRRSAAPAAHALYRARVSAGSVRRFADRARRRRLRAMVPVLVGAGVVVLALVAAWVVLASPFVRAEEVQVVGAERVTPEQVDLALDDQVGRPLARVDTRAVEARLEQLAPVRSARVQRVWPSTVEVHLTERVPVAAVPGEDGFALVDEEGATVETVPEPPAGLAVVGEETVAAGGPALDAAVTVLQQMPADLRATVAGTSAATPDSVTLALTSGAEVVWGSADETERKAAVLRILLGQPAEVYDVSAPGTPVTR